MEEWMMDARMAEWMEWMGYMEDNNSVLRIFEESSSLPVDWLL